MTRSELTIALANRFPQLVMKDVDISVKEILDKIGETLVDGHRVEIRGFGSFSLNYRPARQGRNPKTGEEIPITARRVVTFHASQKLKGMVELKYANSHSL